MPLVVTEILGRLARQPVGRGDNELRLAMVTL